MDEPEQVPSLFALKISSGSIKVKRESLPELQPTEGESDSLPEEQLIKSDSKSKNKMKTVAKVVSFMTDSYKVHDSDQSLSVTDTALDDEIIKYNQQGSTDYLGKIENQTVKSPSTGSLSTSFRRSNNSTEDKQLKINQHVDEPSKSDETMDYYGWDGDEARFKESITDESEVSMPKCIPPWAKTLQKKYGVTSSFSEEQNMRDKIKNIMAKYSDLMLVKRVESKKQLIVEPKCHGDIDTVKMRAKNTKYYMAPITKKCAKESVDYGSHIGTYDGENRLSLPQTNDNESMSITRKTSKHHAKKELSAVLKTMHKRSVEKLKMPSENEYSTKKGKIKCPKITLSKIREYVDKQALDQDERKLHEIIKIEKVPSKNIDDRVKLGSKYIINVPQSTTTDKATINVIKIKEKQKLRSNNIEDINEKVTEVHYTQGSSRQHKRIENELLPQMNLESEMVENIERKEKSPTKTKTFQVISKQTPIIAPLIEHEGKKTDKVLLIQYEKKSKPSKTPRDSAPTTCTTQLLGIKQSPSEDVGQMYLYGSEGVGTNARENITKVDDVSPSLKDKVNLIFKELREMAFKPVPSKILTTSEVQVSPSVTAQTTQHPHHLVTTEVATVQTIPDVRSVEVQVRQSQLLRADYSSTAVSHTIPSSEMLTGKTKIEKKEEIGEKSSEEASSPLDLIGDTHKSEGIKLLTDKEEGLSKTDSIGDIIERQGSHPGSLIVTDESKEDKDELPKLEIDTGEQLPIEDTQFKKIEDKAEPSFHVIQTETPQLEDIDILKDDTFKVSEREIDSKKEETRLIKRELTHEKAALKDDLLPKTDVEAESMIVSEIVEEDETTPFKVEEDEIKVITADEKLSRSSKESKESSLIPDEMKDFTFIRSLKEEDIRSYDIDPNQGTELKIKSSSKFLHKRDSIRKKMNWTDNTIYLEKNTCRQLIRGLAETAVQRPADPIHFLAHWIYKNRHNQESEEQNEVFKEHLYLAKTMMEVSQENNLKHTKFNLRKYPVAQLSQEKSKFSEEKSHNSQIVE